LLVGEIGFGAWLSACALAAAYSRAGEGVQRGYKDFFMSVEGAEPIQITGVS
jgi:hypothetical protein